MTALRFTWDRHHGHVAYAGALGLLGSLCLPWTHFDGQLQFSALMTAQVFHSAFGWLLFLLLTSGLVTLLRPAHNMRLLAEVTAVGALPVWIAMGTMTLAGIQHNTMAPGFYLAGLSCAALCAGGSVDLLRRAQRAPTPALAPSYPSHCGELPLG